MHDDPEKRRLELLFMLLVVDDGSLHSAAIALGWEAGGPEFELDKSQLELDKSQLLSEGAIEPVGVRPGMVDEELYVVTPAGMQMLRDADFPVKP
jgi:hypothetical protein